MLNEKQVKELAQILGPDRVSTRTVDKVAYSRDLWPLFQIGFAEADSPVREPQPGEPAAKPDLKIVRPGEPYPADAPAAEDSFPGEHPPDAIVWPDSTEEVARILEWADGKEIPVIPFGAGSGVCGGTVPIEGGIVLDLKRMDQLVGIDEESCLVTARAGIIGEILERELGEKGFTLGHFPSSMYCSTLGGWLATRSAGQASTRYGKIEDMVLGLTAVLPGGKVVETRVAPRAATGPDLKQLFIGSEGVLGVITEATLRIHPAPPERVFAGAEFGGVHPGLQAIRALLQKGICPAVVRLYDEIDTFIVGSRGKDAGEISLPDGKGKGEGWAARMKDGILRKGERFFLTHPKMLKRLTDLAPDKCLLILVFEGTEKQARLEEAQARALVEGSGGKWLGPEPARRWWESRYAVSYQQSKIFAGGGFVDTVEISTVWSRLENLYASMKSALSPHCLVLAHFSHAYATGCSIYFTVVGSAPTTGEKKELYRTVWDIAMNTCVREGGSISHHHGIGRLKGKWMADEWGEAGMETLIAIKKALDPKGIMNPGKLGME